MNRSRTEFVRWETDFDVLLDIMEHLVNWLNVAIMKSQMTVTGTVELPRFITDDIHVNFIYNKDNSGVIIL